jgi:restriction endonuclease
MKRYRPVDTISKVEMHQKLNQISMKRGSNLSSQLQDNQINGLQIQKVSATFASG